MRRLLILSLPLISVIALVAFVAVAATPAAPAAAPATMATDWFPPNPYPSGQSSADVPLPFEIPCESPKKRSKDCADKARKKYQDGIVALNDFSHGQYNTLTGQFGDLMDHFGEETQLCLSNAQGNYAAEQACWAANQAASQSAYDSYDTMLLALSVNHFNATQSLRRQLVADLEDCCYYVTPIR